MPDPIQTNPELYHVLFENERVRVLEYLDHPGDRTSPHSHPDSVMVTLGSFTRRLWSGNREVELDLPERVEVDGRVGRRAHLVDRLVEGLERHAFGQEGGQVDLDLVRLELRHGVRA